MSWYFVNEKRGIIEEIEIGSKSNVYSLQTGKKLDLPADVPIWSNFSIARNYAIKNKLLGVKKSENEQKFPF